MPTYTVTDPLTGRKLRLTGDTPPTEQELEEIFGATGGQQQPAAATPTEPEDALQWAGGAARDANRKILTNLGSLPALAMDVAAFIPRKAVEAITGDPIESYSSALQRGISELGFTPGDTRGQRLVGDIAGGVASAAGGVGIGQQLAKSAGPVVGGVGRTLAAAPATQAIAGAGAGGASGLAREAGFGPGAQLAAGLAGGLAAPMLLPRSMGGLIGPAPKESAAVLRPEAPEGDVVAASVKSQASEPYKRAVAELKEAGIPLTTGQQTGQNWVKMTERTLSETPIGGTPLQRTFEAQQKAYQRELLRRAGLDDGSDMITDDTLSRARDALNAKYADALKGKEVDLSGDKFLNQLAEVEAKHSQMLPFEQRKQVSDIVSQTLDEAVAREKSGMKLTGEEYQRIRSNLGEKARSTKNTYISSLYRDLKKTFDDAFLDAGGEKVFKVNSEFARLKQLENILERTGGPAMSEGFISPAAVSRQAAGEAGGKDWQQFTRSAAAVLPDRVGNSGTAQRNMVIGAIGGGGAMMDPTSLVYGPALARALSSGLARGSGQSIVSPNIQAGDFGRLGYPAALAVLQQQRGQ